MLPCCTSSTLFFVACAASSLCLLSYLVGFSCELSWILESPDALPVAAHILCAGQLLIFVACTALVYGLATGTPLGAVIWSSVLIVFMAPELALVIYTVTHHWGLQSNHGQTELIGYLIRLLFDSVALLSVIPLVLRWREEQRVLSQLEMLTSHSSLMASPNPGQTTVMMMNHSDDLPPSAGTSSRRGSRASSLRSHKKSNKMPLIGGGMRNNAYLMDETDSCSVKSATAGMYDSQSEFDASLFSPGSIYEHHNALYAKRARSLMDLRNVTTSTATTAVAPEKQQLPEHLLRKPTDSNFIAAMKQYWLTNALKQDGGVGCGQLSTLDTRIPYDNKLNYYYSDDRNKQNMTERGKSDIPFAPVAHQRKSQSLVDLNSLSSIKDDLYKKNSLGQNLMCFHQYRGGGKDPAMMLMKMNNLYNTGVGGTYQNNNRGFAPPPPYGYGACHPSLARTQSGYLVQGFDGGGGGAEEGSYYYTSSNNVCYVPPPRVADFVRMSQRQHQHRQHQQQQRMLSSSSSNGNSRVSLGSDDFTKYRDVAL